MSTARKRNRAARSANSNGHQVSVLSRALEAAMQRHRRLRAEVVSTAREIRQTFAKLKKVVTPRPLGARHSRPPRYVPPREAE
jgi:hypothetical protein